MLLGLAVRSSVNYFVERPKYPFEDLENRLDEKRFLILSGFAATGKTEIAKQFVSKMFQEKTKYKGFIWLAADSESELLASISNVARKVGLEVEGSSKMKLWQAIVKHKDVGKNWLVVFDNLEDVSVLKDLNIEALSEVNVIITTRNSREFARLGGSLIQIDSFDTEQAIQLFRMEYKAQFGLYPHSTDEELSTITDKVGNHPGAICQVVSFLQVKGVTVGNWLRLYASSAWRFWVWQTPEIPSLVSQLSSAFLKIRDNVDSMRLLCLLSFFRADNISLWLLQSNPWVQGTPISRILGSEWELDDALSFLLTWSFVTSTPKTLSIHRVAQEVIKVLLEQPAEDKAGVLKLLTEVERTVPYWIGRAAELLYPMQGQFEWRNFTDQREIAQHTERCMEHCDVYNADCVINRTLLQCFFAYISLKSGQKYRSNLWSEAIQLYEAIEEDQLGLKEGLLCHFISLRLFILQDYEGANKALKLAQQSSEKLSYQDNKWTLQYFYHAGCIKFAQNLYHEAEGFFRHVDTKLIEFYGGDEIYQRVIPLILIGYCLRDKYNAALELGIQAREITRRALSTTKGASDSYEAAESSLPYMLIGCIFVIHGKIKEGIMNCEKALKLCGNSPRAIDLIQRIGPIFQGLERHEEALDWFRKVEPTCEKLYRDQSILCANTFESMAISDAYLGNYEKALQRFEKAYELIKSFENPNESSKPSKLELNARISSFATSFAKLARSSSSIHYYNLAKSLRQCALILLNQPPLSPGLYRGRQLERLANLHETQGELEEAQIRLEEAVRVLQDAVGGAHEDVVKAKESLARVTRILEKQQAKSTQPPKLDTPNPSEPEREVPNSPKIDLEWNEPREEPVFGFECNQLTMAVFVIVLALVVYGSLQKLT